MKPAVDFTHGCCAEVGSEGASQGKISAARTEAGLVPATRLTGIFSVPVAPDEVRQALGDVEALPRWTAGFCERVEIVCGHWVAWTVLGELFVAVESDAATGDVMVRVGWCPRRSITLRWRIRPQAEGGTRVEWTAADLSEVDDLRLARAWREAWVEAWPWGGAARIDALAERAS